MLKIENIELAKTLEQGEETQKTLEIQRLEEKELEEALEKAEKQERKEEEGLQDEERIAMEFHETGGEHCWSCAHDPCLCSLLKLEMRLEMLRSLNNSTKIKNNPYP